jgi:two-component system sensor histidine kinase DesK
MRLRLLPPDSPVGWTPFAWLIYISIFLFYGYLGNTPGEWVLDGIALVAFLVLYFRGFWVGGTALLRIAFAIVAIAVVVTPHNPGASCFFIYAAAFVGEIAPPARSIRWIAVIIAIVGLETWIFDLPPQSWVPAVVFSIIVGGSNLHFAEVRRKDQALIQAHELAGQLARTAERERIARDLHDLLGHTLSVIVLKSELAAKLADRNPARAAIEIREVEQISRNALAEVRHAIHGYRGEGLASEIEKGRKALESAGVALEADVEPVALGADEERALALGLREALTNIVRHAHATVCRVTLAREANDIVLTVLDDGVGGELVEGAGLSGMRTRLGAVGGQLQVDGRSGARLVLSVPARQAAADGVLAAS